MEKIQCSIFCEDECSSIKYKGHCNGCFYKCAKINTKKHYKYALEKFQQIKNGEQFSAKDERDDFNLKREPCDPRLDEQYIPTKNKQKGGTVENNDEDFICKCYYLCSTGGCNNTQCKRYFVAPTSDYRIIDYQMPPQKGNCGKVDLVIKNGNTVYLTEVKPPVGNSETLLRMLCEILHHYPNLNQNAEYVKYCVARYGVDESKLKILPAIMFFKNSAQSKEYANANEIIKQAIEEFAVTVFECDNDTKIITKIN